MQYNHRQAEWRLAGRFALIGVAAIVVLFSLPGCGKSERNTGVEKGTAPTSSISRIQGEAIARDIANRLGGSRHYPLRISTTGSMEPLLNSYAYLVLEKTDGKDLKVGQLVNFKSPTGAFTILHRVSVVGKDSFIADGVSNASNDGWVSYDRLLGRVVAIVYTNEPNKQ